MTDAELLTNYASGEANPHRLGGARGFAAYLQGLTPAKTLATATSADLGTWATTPISKGNGRGNLPDATVYAGAKAVCARGAEAGYIPTAANAAIQALARPSFTLESLTAVLGDPQRTGPQKDAELLTNYASGEANPHRLGGARGFAAYLQGLTPAKTLATATSADLGTWATTPISKGNGRGNLPDATVYAGAKAVCARGAEAGYIPTAANAAIQALARPSFTLESLTAVLGDPQRTGPQKDAELLTNYASGEADSHRLGGARGFAAYLQGLTPAKTLATATSADLGTWATTPISKGKGRGKLPDATAYAGAQAVCARGAEAGYIPTAANAAIQALARPSFTLESLTAVLGDPQRTGPQKDAELLTNYASGEANPNRLAGPRGFAAYLQGLTPAKTLATATSADLGTWATTPISKGKGRGNLPDATAYAGAKAVCARGAEAGYIPTAANAAIQALARPSFTLESLTAVLGDPQRTGPQKDAELLTNYASGEADSHRLGGARGFAAYLQGLTPAKTLATATSADLGTWATTPISKGKGRGKLPDATAYAGAQAVCARGAEAGYIPTAANAAIQALARPSFTLESLTAVLGDPQRTGPQKDAELLTNYASGEADSHRLGGARGFAAYLQGLTPAKTLATATSADLGTWATTPISKGNGRGNLPDATAYAGAKAVCARGAEAGYIPTAANAAIQALARPSFTLESLTAVLGDPQRTGPQKDAELLTNYASGEADSHRLGGARGFAAYLQGLTPAKTLATATSADLGTWATTPISKGKGRGKLPDATAYAGAQAVCARGAEAGYIPTAANAAIQALARPSFTLESLTAVLGDPQRTGPQKDAELLTNYASGEANPHRLAGARGFAAYLQGLTPAKTLATATSADLGTWATTPISKGKGRGKLPDARAYAGAQAVCARGAEAGYIPTAANAAIQALGAGRKGKARAGTPGSDHGSSESESEREDADPWAHERSSASWPGNFSAGLGLSDQAETAMLAQTLEASRQEQRDAQTQLARGQGSSVGAGSSMGPGTWTNPQEFGGLGGSWGGLDPTGYAEPGGSGSESFMSYDAPGGSGSGVGGKRTATQAEFEEYPPRLNPASRSGLAPISSTGLTAGISGISVDRSLPEQPVPDELGPDDSRSAANTRTELYDLLRRAASAGAGAKSSHLSISAILTDPDQSVKNTAIKLANDLSSSKEPTDQICYRILYAAFQQHVVPENTASSISAEQFSTMYAPPPGPPPMLTAYETGQAYPQLQGTPEITGRLYLYQGSPVNSTLNHHWFIPDGQQNGYDAGSSPIPEAIFNQQSLDTRGGFVPAVLHNGIVSFPQPQDLQQGDAPLLAGASYGTYPPPPGQERGASNQGHQGWLR